jgi:hypothetical protein
MSDDVTPVADDAAPVAPKPKKGAAAAEPAVPLWAGVSEDMIPPASN